MLMLSQSETPHPSPVGVSLFSMGSLPVFDTRPEDPLFGPLSMWINGDNPVDPLERPETLDDLAEALGVPVEVLVRKRNMKRFAEFHLTHANRLTTLAIRRQQLLDNLFAQAEEGSVQAAALFLQHTRAADSLAAAGRNTSAGFTPAELASMTDAELDKLTNQ